MKIKGAVALVTGANRGIGKALVEALLKQGVKKVYATVRNSAALEGFKGMETTCLDTLVVDVTKFEHFQEAAKVASDVNLLINNAGVLELGSVADVSADAMRRTMDVNFYGPLYAAQVFAPVVENNGGGAIVNLLTLVAMASMPGIGAYNASKAAAWSLTQSLRADLGKKKIEVFGVFPGAIDTDMIKAFEMPKTSPAFVAEAVLAGIEQGHEDIFPDPMSQEVYANWKADHKAVERMFASM